MTSPDSAPRPLSLRALRDDDALLDELGGRRTHPQLAAEPVAMLLGALAADVDRDLPTGLDRLATQALAAALGQAERRPGSVRTAPAAHVLPVRSPAPQPTGRMVRVRRGTAAMVAAAFVLGSAGIAAAVTGSVPDATFVSRVVRLLTGAPAPAPTTNPESALRATRSELARRLSEQARRPAGPDAAELTRLLRLAATLPDGGGPGVQALVRQLRAKQALATGKPRAKVPPVRKESATASVAPVPAAQSTAGTAKPPAPSPGETRRPRTASAAPTSASAAPTTKAPLAEKRVGSGTGSAQPKTATARG